MTELPSRTGGCKLILAVVFMHSVLSQELCRKATYSCDSLLSYSSVICSWDHKLKKIFHIHIFVSSLTILQRGLHSACPFILYGNFSDNFGFACAPSSAGSTDIT